MLLELINFVGHYFLLICEQLGSFTIFFLRTFSTLFTTKLKLHQVIIQLEQIGVKSFAQIVLTGISAGFVLALQAYTGLSKFGGEELIGLIVAMGITRELGPVLTALMITGRKGSAMAAEIATMQITEQVDALQSLNIDPYQYLIVPRVVASVIILPFLTSLSMFFGIAGGYIYSIYMLDLNYEIYISSIESYIEIFDIIGGLIKALAFGLIISLVGTYMGYHTKGGAHEVGISTTKSVVIGSIMVIIANYFLSLMLY